MHQRVQFADSIEPLVRLIEEAPHDQIRERALEKLRDGVPIKTMLTASALAVTRSADLPPDRYGGPLPPLAGLYAISKLVDRLEGEDRFIPVLEHVALANKHVHDPETSPFALLDFAPLDAKAASAGGPADLAADGDGDVVAEGDDVGATKKAFLKACDRGESNKADHLFLWLWQQIPPMEAFDLLMSVAIPKKVLDDHYLLFPAYTWRALHSVLGSEYLTVLMRPAVRYVARLPQQRSVPEADALIEQHDLLKRILRQRTGEDETLAIGTLGEGIRNCNSYGEIPAMIAKALADGLSLEGAGEALSIGAADLFLRSLTGNPIDVHLHASANVRRWLLQLNGLTIKNKLLILLLWCTGPEVKSTQYRVERAPQLDPGSVAALPHRSQEELLEAISQSIYTQPETASSTAANLCRMRAMPEIKITVNLAQQYVNLGYDPELLMKRLGKIVCNDSFTEMHAFEHQQAAVEEFYATREPWRGKHLVCSCHAAAISFGKHIEVFEDEGLTISS